MERGRTESEWNHTAQILCAIANAMGSKKKPKDFHPLLIDAEPEVSTPEELAAALGMKF